MIRSMAVETYHHLWLLGEMADALQSGVTQLNRAIDREQAVYGLDALDEVRLHVSIEQSLRDAGYGVFREQRYPADRKKRRRSEGERCDFVLTPHARPLVREAAQGTLFDDPSAIELDAAFWLEMKVVHQFTTEGANPNYSSQLLSTVRQDVTKLSKDPGILHAGLLLLMFVQDREVCEHDLKIWQDRCLDRGLPIGAPYRREVPIRDRLGNGLIALSLYPVPHL